MPDTCIHDRDEQCYHSCKHCVQHISQCDFCGSKDNLYSFGTETLCFKHLVERVESDYYKDFCKDNSEMFEKYLMDIFDGWKI